MIRLEHIYKTFNGGRTVAVEDVDLVIERGELIVLLGESGCGKTSTLKMINRLIEPAAGRILIDDVDVQNQSPTTLRRSVGYVFQQIGLFPHLSVGENIAIVPQLLGWKKPAVDQRVDDLLQMVHLDPAEFRERQPGELSGGQQQRVGVARALAGRPGIMLMDEPFGALDPLTRDKLQVEYRRIHNALELTSVLVTHDMTEALLLADRIAVMQRGRIVACESPHELLTNPSHEYVRNLMDMPRRQADAIEDLLKNAAGAEHE